MATSKKVAKKVTKKPAKKPARRTARKLSPVQKQWVAALRSGRYKQATHTLHVAGGGYCCLGVLCAVMAPRSWKRKFARGAGDLLNDAGLAAASITDKQQRVLARENDAGRSFKYIATYIEKKL